MLDLPVGMFAPGRQFDALLIDGDAPGSNLVLQPGDRPEQLLERIVHTAGRANIARVWVDGRVVHDLRSPGSPAGRENIDHGIRGRPARS